MIRARSLFIAIAALAVSVPVAALAAGTAPRTAEEQAVVAAVQRTFDGMAERDTEKMRASFLPQAQIFLVGPNPEPRVITVEQFATGIAGRTTAILERMWEPKVQIDGRMATLWAPYDLHVDGEFSHCGVDAVQLVKVRDGWKISSITYTMQREGCAPSPLGPPKN